MWQCTLIITTVTLCAVNSIHWLPKYIKPLRYAITIEPNLTVTYHPSSFQGKVTIQLLARRQTESITLHAVDLKIDASTIKVVGPNGRVPVESAKPYDPDQIYIIKLKQNLLKGHLYTLTVGKYTGSMHFNSRGLFKAAYFSNGSRKLAAVTHFQPTFARYAFPCFDEPHQKARFTVSIIRDKYHHSISNEELDHIEKLGGNRFMDVFKETPLMSTYTLAFAVSDFGYSRRERIRIYAQPEAFVLNELELPLNYSINVLKQSEDYFGVNFTLSKIDSFAIPIYSFIYHAMENWGLITYGENFIRCTNNTSFRTLRTILGAISHEFAHQWFGNLVTPASWNYMWLSESFSAYFQYFIASKVEPSWRYMDLFAVEIVLDGFANEEMKGAHELNHKISYYGEFPPLYIMYQKGSSVVQMISHFLTPDLFRKALRNYFLERQFKNVVPADLYSSLQKTVDEEGVHYLVGGNSVDDILSTWDSYKGYPTVYVTRNYETGETIVAQTSELVPNRHLLKIPINYVSSSVEINFDDTRANFWLTSRGEMLKTSTKGWLIFNKKLSGYYRVNYDLENWERIIRALNIVDFKKIHVINRAQLINDAFYFAHRDQLPIDIPFRLAEYLVREKDYVAFASFYKSLERYTRIFHAAPTEKETEYFLNHPLKDFVTEQANNHPKAYMVFRLYIRTIISDVRKYLLDKLSSNSLILLDELHYKYIKIHFYGFFDECANCIIELA